MTVGAFNELGADDAVDIEALKANSDNTVTVEPLENGQQVVRVNTTARTKRQETESTGANSGEPSYTDVSNEITLFLDKDGKLVAKELKQTEGNNSPVTVSTTFSRFQEVFGEEFESNIVERGDGGTEGASGTIVSANDAGSRDDSSVSQSTITRVQNAGGPVGGDVATGEDAEEIYIEGVIAEADELGSGENPISPII